MVAPVFRGMEWRNVDVIQDTLVLSVRIVSSGHLTFDSKKEKNRFMKINRCVFKELLYGVVDNGSFLVYDCQGPYMTLNPIYQRTSFLFISDIGCEENPCENGGTCHATTNRTLSCECAKGFGGKLCDERELLEW